MIWLISKDLYMSEKIIKLTNQKAGTPFLLVKMDW